MIYTWLQFLTDSKQENTDNDDADKDIGFPGKLFFQENTGKQQGNNTDRRNDGCCNGAVSAQGIYISELAGGFEDCSEDLILVLGDGTELDFLGFHEDEQTQCKQSKGQFVAGIGNIFNGFFGDTDKGSAGNIVQIENINKGAESIQNCIDKASKTQTAIIAVKAIDTIKKTNETGINSKYIDKIAKAESEINSSSGVISIYGERWEARSENNTVIPQGSEVKIVRNDSIIMYVTKVTK